MNSIHKDQAKYLFSLPWFRRWQWIHRFIKCIILNWILLHMIYMMLGLLGSKLKFSFQTVFFSLLLKELINIFSFPFNFCLLSSRGKRIFTAHILSASHKFVVTTICFGVRHTLVHSQIPLLITWLTCSLSLSLLVYKIEAIILHLTKGRILWDHIQLKAFTQWL